MFYQYELVYPNPKLGTFELWTKLEKVETGRTRLMAMDSLEYINSVSTLMDYFTFLDGSFFRQRVLCSKSLWSLSYTVTVDKSCLDKSHVMIYFHLGLFFIL